LTKRNNNRMRKLKIILIGPLPPQKNDRYKMTS
jgi:hypothetical protein